jgi:hypothetical protein
MMLTHSSGTHRRYHPIGAGFSGALAASDVGLVPGGFKLELASTAAASACGLVIADLEAMNSTQIPGIDAGFTQ